MFLVVILFAFIIMYLCVGCTLTIWSKKDGYKIYRTGFRPRKQYYSR